MQSWERVIYTISPKTRATQCQPIDRKKRKEKIEEDYSRDRRPIKKTIGIAFESRQSYTIEYGFRKIVPEGHEQRINGLQYREVLQRGGAEVYRCATRAPRITRTGTYGSSRAPLRGCIGLHLILYNIQRTATDRPWAMSHSNTPPVTNQAPLFNQAWRWLGASSGVGSGWLLYYQCN